MERTVWSSLSAIVFFRLSRLTEEKGKKKVTSGLFLSPRLRFLFYNTRSTPNSHDPRHFQKVPLLLRSLPQGFGRVAPELGDLVGAERESPLSSSSCLVRCCCLLLSQPLLLLLRLEVDGLELVEPGDDLPDLGLPVGDLVELMMLSF